MRDASRAAIAFAILSHALPANGQAEAPGGEAKKSFEKGVELYNQQDYQGALAEFLAAYEAKPHHSVLYNIAQCYEMIDSGAKALHYYEMYLEEGADYITETRRQKVEAEIEKLRGQLTPLSLSVEPDGAEVLIDGKTVGSSPIEKQYVDPGEHTLIVQKDGHETWKKSFVAKRGVPLSLEVTLAVKAKPVEPGGDAGKKPVEPEHGEEGPVEKPAKAKGKVPVAAPASTGALALAAGVAAVVVGVMSSKHHDEFAELREEIASGTYTGSDPQGAYRDSKDRGEALNAGFVATIGVACAAAVATAVLVPFAVPKRKPVEIRATGPGLSVAVSF